MTLMNKWKKNKRIAKKCSRSRAIDQPYSKWYHHCLVYRFFFPHCLLFCEQNILITITLISRMLFVSKRASALAILHKKKNKLKKYENRSTQLNNERDLFFCSAFGIRLCSRYLSATGTQSVVRRSTWLIVKIQSKRDDTNVSKRDTATGNLENKIRKIVWLPLEANGQKWWTQNVCETHKLNWKTLYFFDSHLAQLTIRRCRAYFIAKCVNF